MNNASRAAMALCLAAVFPPAWADAAPQGWQGVELVQELLRLDAEAALASERGRATPPPVSSAPSSAAQALPGGMRLEAIYGIGKRLHAELTIDGQRHVYRAGQRLPMGMPFEDGAPMLERIAGACVVLSRDSATERLCLRRPDADGGTP